METRDLFERLVNNEPPLRLNSADLSAAGRKTARRQARGAAGLTVAVLVVAIIATTQIVRPAQRHGGTLGGSGPAISSFPLASPAQVATAEAQIYSLLLAQTPGATRVASGSAGVWISPPGSSTPDVAGARTIYQLPQGAADLTVMTATPTESRKLEDWLVAESPCKARPVVAQGLTTGFSQCTRVQLRGGAVLWTYLQRQVDASHGGPPTTMTNGRYAVIVAGDGSTMALSFGLDQEVDLGQDPQVNIAPSLASLAALVLHAAAAWQAAG
ncbi:MAG: hypothetical protein QOI76_1515 [Frankiales bacterium]|jgi:hypothetical protein|nr:hypothetical protein [Frankiales bacterium]